MAIELQELLKKSGLTLDEINRMSERELLQSFYLISNKYFGEIQIIFAGFSEEQMLELNKTAKQLGMTVKLQLSPNISFFCIGQSISSNRLKKAEEFNTIILTDNLFNEISKVEKIDFSNNSIFINENVTPDLRVFVPFSKFDIKHEIKSFSSEEIYSLNLKHMTCTCADFIKNNRGRFEPGDIRRLCKHLIELYSQLIGSIGLSEINFSIIKNGHGINSNYDILKIGETNNRVGIIYDNERPWCDVYAKNKNGEYERYGYDKIERRWSYNEKPPSIAKQIEDLISPKLKNVISNIDTKVQNKKDNNPERIGGCIGILLIIAVIIGVLYIVYKIFS